MGLFVLLLGTFVTESRQKSAPLLHSPNPIRPAVNDVLAAAIYADWIYYAKGDSSPRDPKATVLEFIPERLDTSRIAIIGRKAAPGRAIFVTVRGTDSALDWLGNAAVLPRKVKTVFGKVKMHSGFESFANNCLEQIVSVLRKACQKEWIGARIIFCGHSLGGAVARTLELLIHQLFPEISQLTAVITFGSPKSIFAQADDSETAASLDLIRKRGIARAIEFVHPNDHVPNILGPNARSVLTSQWLDMAILDVEYLESIRNIMQSYTDVIPDAIKHISVEYATNAHSMAEVYLQGSILWMLAGRGEATLAAAFGFTFMDELCSGSWWRIDKWYKWLDGYSSCAASWVVGQMRTVLAFVGNVKQKTCTTEAMTSSDFCQKIEMVKFQIEANLADYLGSLGSACLGETFQGICTLQNASLLDIDHDWNMLGLERVPLAALDMGLRVLGGLYLRTACPLSNVCSISAKVKDELMHLVRGILESKSTPYQDIIADALVMQESGEAAALAIADQTRNILNRAGGFYLA